MPPFELPVHGPFSLAAAMDFAGGFPAGIGGGGVGDRSITMAFPIEGVEASAAVKLWQDASGSVRARTDVPEELVEAAARQAARSLSLDHDGTGWPDVGDRDPVIGELQRQYGFLRPVCFYSAYEAVTSFVIGHRISRVQGASIKRALSAELGDRPTIEGVEVRAFPRPSRLLELERVKGLSDEKVRRLHALARAALDGRLDTERLRALPAEEALAELRTLPGVGPFTADSVLYRGCGVVDGLPASDDLTREVVGDLYGQADVSRATLEARADGWRPYRMWAVVLLRVGWTRRQPGPVSYRREPAAGRRTQSAPSMTDETPVRDAG
jgi:DNA-3-methyladenine glycosylase II